MSEDLSKYALAQILWSPSLMISHSVRFGAKKPTKKKPDPEIHGRDAADSFPTSTTTELLSSNQMKSGAQSYKSVKPKAPRPSDVSDNNTSSKSNEAGQKKSWWTQLKFKGGD